MNKMNKTKKILIVGAGIAGITLFRLLKDKGFKNVKIIEKNKKFRSEGCAICLPFNAVDQIDKIGLKDKLLKLSHQVDKIEYAKHNGKNLTTASLLEKPLNNQPFLSLLREDLLKLLAGNYQEEVNYNLSITKIHFDLTSAKSKVNFNNKKQEEFDLIIGADGINSSIRKIAFEEKSLFDLEVTNWRFISKTKQNNLHPKYFIGKDEAFMIYPMSNKKIYCYAQISDKGNKYKNSDFNKLKDIFKDYNLEVINAISNHVNNKIIEGRLKSVISREVFSYTSVLVGDALHGCPPTLQQGVAMALEDVVILSNLLDTSKSIDIALSSFKSKRLKKIDWIINESNRLVQLAKKGKYLLGRIIRNIIVKKGEPANVTAWKKIANDEF
tara:strand:- start:2560 stop:3708 length:1149 start_codon:yes stop_codon:yes gene_type:complete